MPIKWDNSGPSLRAYWLGSLANSEARKTGYHLPLLFFVCLLFLFFYCFIIITSNASGLSGSLVV